MEPVVVAPTLADVHSKNAAPRGVHPVRRRDAIALLGALALSGCGGGGGGGTTTEGVSEAAADPGAAAAAAPVPTSSLSLNIAAWGDSLTPGYAQQLQLMYPNRTVFDGGFGGDTSGQVLARQRADGSAHTDWINVFWYGHNNIGEIEQIKADMAASVAALHGNPHFIVLGVVNADAPVQIRGGGWYEPPLQLNRDWAATYGDHFIDIRAYLISQFNPSSPEDVQDVQDDVVPATFRSDQIHLSYAGQLAVATRVKQYIDSHGW
jgi:lysophospholipase L1-like esterase